MATGGVDDLEKGTDETFDFLCSVCNSKDKISEAKLFCSDCHDYYCSICVKCHDDIPALKKHRILNKAEFQHSDDSFPTVPTEQCKVHGHKPVDMYCKVHDSVGCSTCMVVEHSACADKFYVPEFVKRNTTAVNTKYTTDMLAAISKSLKDMEKAVIKQKEKLESNKNQIAQQIRKLRENINQLLDDLEKKTFQELERSFQSLIQTAEEKLKELQAAKAEVESAVDGLNSAGGNKSQAFVRISITKNVVSQAKEILSSATCQNYSKEISFDADQKVQSLLKEIHVLGSVSLTEYTDSQPVACSHESLTPVTNIQSNQRFQVNQSELSLLQITGKKRYSVRVDSDTETCDIFSACTLEDGTVILADNKNCKLKRLHRSKYTVTDWCDLPGRAWQVCAISDQLVAVCLSTKEIHFVAVRNTMQKVRKIRMNHPCYGITCADEKLFVSAANSVNVYAVSGEFLQHFASDLTMPELFSDIECITVSNDKTKIYVADRKQGFIILDINGLLVRHVKGTASGICFHKTGSVLVDCRASRNILQYSSNGKLIGEVLKTDHECQTVCCNINDSKLVVCFVNSDTIEVYDVKSENTF